MQSIHDMRAFMLSARNQSYAVKRKKHMTTVCVYGRLLGSAGRCARAKESAYGYLRFISKLHTINVVLWQTIVTNVTLLHHDFIFE